MTVDHATDDHVVAGDNAIRCLHCGDEFKLPSDGVTISMFVAIGKAFAAEHKGCTPTKRGTAKMNATSVVDWIHSWDTGMSSKTIWHFFMGNLGTHEGRRAIPYDPSDFGRCYRLLKIAPGWRERLGELGAHLPYWEPFTDAWSELEVLYEEELQRPDHRAPKLYARMKEIVREAERIRYPARETR